jgi:hypothetical protein
VQIHYWLKYYVMLRLLDRDAPKGVVQMKPTMASFVVSAFWHGTYPGFFIFFISSFIVDMAMRGFPKVALVAQIRAFVPLSLDTFMRWAFSQYFIGYFAMSFVYLELEPTI